MLAGQGPWYAARSPPLPGIVHGEQELQRRRSPGPPALLPFPPFLPLPPFPFRGSNVEEEVMGASFPPFLFIDASSHG